MAAGIRYQGRADLALIEIAPGSTTAAVFTRNVFCAAPVVIAKRHLAQRMPRYLLINAGNANAGTGQIGIEDAQSCCQVLAAHAGCNAEEVLPFSTGVIGQRLAVEKLIDALPAALEQLAPRAWLPAATAIMTTDTVAKGASRTLLVDGKPVVITGIAKGAGMIRPDMATMLAFVATDARIAQPLLHEMLREAVESSFHRITVDGDTSTNDACVLVATGRGSVEIDAGSSEARTRFQNALSDLMIELAQAIVRDGEGATKFITVRVRGAASIDQARRIAFTVAHSPLVKTAFFASDPNWGRILAAVGRAGIEAAVMDRVNVFLDELCVVRAGVLDDDYAEAAGQRVMARPEIEISIDLQHGDYAYCVWTSDLSYDYVRINAEYRS
jgi:glutamate N-acetyltransferase / amino-acid N-acetyltransferase